MISVGIDVGTRAVKALVLRDGEVLGRAGTVAGFDLASAASTALDQALAAAGLARDRVATLVATGAGRDEVDGRDRGLTEVGCVARGAAFLLPGVRTVLDVGAEEARAVRVGENGTVVDFAVNEKCAAGVGAFTEAVARALEVPLTELGRLSLASRERIPLNAHCVVFAESEVVSMIHGNVAKEDVARAVHDAIATRVTAMVRRVDPRPPLALVGGMAHNSGFVDALGGAIGLGNLQVPDFPDYCGALGAALAGAQRSGRGAGR